MSAEHTTSNTLAAPRFALSGNVARNGMSSLELLALVNEVRAEFGESEVRHNDFVNRCRDELEGEFYETFVIKPDGPGRPSEAIGMTADQCKLVAMRESKGVRRRVLARLNELEAQQQPRIPQSLSEALRLAADQAEQIERQQQALAIAAPKAEFVDRYVDTHGLKGFRQVAKMIGAKENAFRKFLEDKRIMYKVGGAWVPYAPHLDAGRFAVKTGIGKHSDKAYTDTQFTPKGVQWIAGLWAVHQVEQAMESAGDGRAIRGYKEDRA